MSHYWQPKTLGLFLIISLVGVAGLVSRFWQIDSIPTALSQDEIVYAVNSRSLALTGRGKAGDWSPLSLTPMHADFAELPSAVMAPFHLLPVSPVLATKLPFILMSLSLPLILGLLAYRLTQSKSTAFATALITLFNPWIWQFGRLSFDSYFSLFFLLSGTLVFTSGRQWLKLWALPLFFLAFYQYQGHKLVFFPWIFAWSLFLFFESGKLKIKYWKHHLPLVIVVGLTGLLLMVYIFIQLPMQTSSERLSSIVTPNHELIEITTQSRRQLSLGSPLNKFLINKPAVWIEHIVARYVSIYNPHFLFIEGQANTSAFAVWNHGIFYIVDILLIGAGMVALVNRKRKELAILMAGILLLSPLPAVLAEGQWYVFRASLIVPVLLLLAGMGAGYLAQKLPKWLLIFLIAIYVFSITRFAFTYFVQYPIISAERHYFTEKIISNYISRIHPSRSVIVFTPETDFAFNSYVFYNNLLSKPSIKSCSKRLCITGLPARECLIYR